MVPRGEALLGVCRICYLLEDLQTLVRSIPNGRTRVILEDGLQVLWETARTRVTEDQASSRAVAQSRDGP